MDVWTVQLSQWRLLQGSDIMFLDTTVKAGTSIFKPSWDIVMKVKKGIITEEEYTETYYELMRESYRRHTAEWIAITTQRIAFSCFCPVGCFCHRYLLVDIYKTICQTKNIPFVYHGEIRKGANHE